MTIPTATLPRPTQSAALELQAEAEARGFIVSWAPVVLPAEWKKSYSEWIVERRNAGLGQLARTLEVRLDPRMRFAWIQSVMTLACLLTDIPVALPTPHPDRCGSCRQCVAYCPTGALLGERRVDLNRCISYWTTSYQELIPFEVRSTIGSWLFGCDICQDVCPWNWKAEKAEWFWKGFQADSDLAYPDLTDAFDLSTQDFARKYAHSAFERVGRLRIVRNALVVLANTKDPTYLPLSFGPRLPGL